MVPVDSLYVQDPGGFGWFCFRRNIVLGAIKDTRYLTSFEGSLTGALGFRTRRLVSDTTGGVVVGVVADPARRPL